MIVWVLLALLFTTATAKKSDYRTVYACEGTQLHITCDEGYLIHLIRANYGRFSISICNEHGNLDWSVDCTAHLSYIVIRERCNLMSNCIVSASSDIFGDPCAGTYKYLEVQYQCVLESMTTFSNSSVMRTTTTTTSSTARPPVIIPITRSTKPTVATTPLRFFKTTATIKSTTTKSTTTTTTTTTTSTKAPTSVITTTTVAPRFHLAHTVKTTPRVTAFNKDDYCPPTHSKNLSWEWTEAGTEIVQKCPGGTFGEARWKCGENPVEWIPEVPDLSECSSLWVDNLRSRVDGGDSVVNIAAELSVMTHRKPLYGGDVRHATEILHRLVSKMADKMKDIADDKQRHQLLKELLESAGDVTSNLLEVSPSWNELPTGERKNIASTLLEALENSGWLLASAHKSTFFYRKALHNIFLSVRVLEAWTVSEITFPSAEEIDGTTWEDFGDRIHLPMQALMGTSANGVVKVYFASYERVKDFLSAEDVSSSDGFLHNTSRMINSRVISAYTGRYPGTKFSEPVTITFKLLQEENVTNPQCVYWDLNSRLWSQEGCWLKSSNKTHAVCECDHLTNFALFMEMKSKSVKLQHPLLSKVVVFTSAIAASVLFLLTEILLLIFRRFPDDHSAIHKHLCFCLVLTEIIYMCGVDKTGLPCALLAGALHFCLQAVFSWFFLYAFQLYLHLVEPAYTSRVLGYSLISYITPILIVGATALIDPQSYGTQKYCFLGFDNYKIFGFVGPAAMCIVGSLIFLVLTIRKVSSPPSSENQEIKFHTIGVRCRDAWFVVIASASCWAFLLLYLQQETAIISYLFATLNCIQGLTVFIFIGLNDTEVQQAYNKWKLRDSCIQPKNTTAQFPLPSATSQHSVEAAYLQPSTTVSSLSTVTTPELEFQLGTFHHSDLCHATRSPIYDNRERLVA
ncbi:latrophilin Cirl-like [Uloborus diversus]|uniref:latrophilin Cirl-like n=1 Tax=Uloborus diversus TaxID=327109 RepID=UPI0024097FCE|nr:latrophilin Cirl-like [Uloborus diversus]